MREGGLNRPIKLLFERKQFLKKSRVVFDLLSRFALFVFTHLVRIIQVKRAWSEVLYVRFVTSEKNGFEFGSAGVFVSAYSEITSGAL